MMSKFTARTVLATFAGLVFSAGAQAAPSMADALFEKTTNAANLAPLSAADRQAIAQKLPFKMLDGKVIDDLEFCKQPVDPEVGLVDLNDDHQPEVVVLAGNTCTSGMTGASIYLLGKFGQEWHLLINVAAIDYKVLKTHGFQGWSDIGLGGRSNCLGRWRFNGKNYIFAGLVDEQGRLCKR